VADTEAVQDEPDEPPTCDHRTEPELSQPSPERSRTETLSVIARMLSATPEVREELAEDIRSQINQGAYMTDERLELAIFRMLKDILR
jgi:hypothetical protein